MSFDHKVRPDLHPLERATLTALALLLVFLPWAFGTMHVWSQSIALALAAVAFVLALWPRVLPSEGRGDEVRVLHPWHRLKHFPLFWIGAVLLGLIVVQALNPSWIYMTDGKAWWMRKGSFIAWLPTSVVSPFSFWSIWRTFMVYTIVWLTICALWVGATRRRSLQILLTVMACNGVAVALVGSAHRMSGTYKVLWIRQFKDAGGFGPLIYHNHGGAFVALLALAAVALGAWHHFEALRRMARSSPALVWVLASLLIAMGVAFSTSRAATGLLSANLLLALVIWVWLRRVAAPASVATSRLISILLACAFVAWSGFVLREVDFSRLTSKFEKLQKMGAEEESYASRVLVRPRAFRMFNDHWIYGTGAGSFRFLFVPYVRDSYTLSEGGKAFWDHAHIDWLEIPIEFGVVGAAIIASGLIWCLVAWVRWRGWRHSIGLFLFLGCVQTMVHALVDFPFQNPAILVTWWALVIIALRWLELDTLLAEARRR